MNAQTASRATPRPAFTHARFLPARAGEAAQPRARAGNEGMAAGFSTLVRWQTAWHVVRQWWAFFQNDFAGRIANRIMQTGPAVRESVVLTLDALWYIIVYGTSALILLASVDRWL